MFLFYDWPFYTRFSAKNVSFCTLILGSVFNDYVISYVDFILAMVICVPVLCCFRHIARYLVENRQFYLLRRWRLRSNDLKLVSQSVIGISPRYLVWKNYSSRVTAKAIPSHSQT